MHDSVSGTVEIRQIIKELSMWEYWQHNTEKLLRKRRLLAKKGVL